MKAFRLKVLGQPQPKGSTKAVPARGQRFAYTINANKKTQPWELTIRMMAKQIWHEAPMICACDIRLWFFFQKPKSINRSHHTVKPDIDKLARCVLDALTGVVFKDDSLVVNLGVKKQYGDIVGVVIEVNQTEQE